MWLRLPSKDNFIPLPIRFIIKSELFDKAGKDTLMYNCETTMRVQDHFCQVGFKLNRQTNGYNSTHTMNPISTTALIHNILLKI